MATQDGAMMSQKISDQTSQKLARITDYMDNTLIRGEQAEEAYLQDWMNRLNKQQERASSAASASKNPAQEMQAPMREQMTFEEFKQRVKQCLMSPGTSTSAEEKMKLYNDELLQYYEEKWTPGVAAAALIMGA